MKKLHRGISYSLSSQLEKDFLAKCAFGCNRFSIVFVEHSTGRMTKSGNIQGIFGEYPVPGVSFVAGL